MVDKILKDIDLGESLFAQGTIDAADDDLIVNIAGLIGVTISVSGEFMGDLEVTGFNDYETKQRGARTVFKSGTGSLGESCIRGYGAMNTEPREYRVVGGSKWLSIRAANFTGIKVDVSVFATKEQSVVFVDGAVQTAEEIAARNGRAYLAAIPQTTVAEDDEVAFVLTNPIDSGSNLFLTERIFGSTETGLNPPLNYRVYLNPTFDPAVVGVIGNRRGERDRDSAAVFKYEKAQAIVMGGIELSGEPIPNGGISRERKLLAIFPPGQSLGFVIRGEIKPAKSADVFATLQWFEEDLI